MKGKIHIIVSSFNMFSQIYFLTKTLYGKKFYFLGEKKKAIVQLLFSIFHISQMQFQEKLIQYVKNVITK